jgi:stage V sporulation protein G
MTTKKTTEEYTANTLQVTYCQVILLKEPRGKIKATANVILNDALQLTALRLIEGSMGLFVSYPNDPSWKGEDYRSLFYPITKDLREHIEKVVLAKYEEIVNA